MINYKFILIALTSFFILGCQSNVNNTKKNKENIEFIQHLEFSNECINTNYLQCYKWICFNNDINNQGHVTELYAKFIDLNDNISLFYHNNKLLKGKVLRSPDLLLFILDNGTVFEVDISGQFDYNKLVFSKINELNISPNLNPIWCYNTFKDTINRNPFKNIN